jgi:hypothetical protein
VTSVVGNDPSRHSIYGPGLETDRRRTRRNG